MSVVNKQDVIHKSTVSCMVLTFIHLRDAVGKNISANSEMPISAICFI